MTVNHDVAGSSPAGGAKTETTQKGGFSFGSFYCSNSAASEINRPARFRAETVKS